MSGEHVVAENTRAKNRIPPGQYRTDKFPVLDLGVQPPVSQEAFRLKAWGAVENPTEWDWKAFQALPRVRLTADFHCVTRWSRLGLGWQGVPARAIMDAVRPQKTAAAVMAHGRDGYTTNLSMADFDHPEVVLADTLDGQHLPLEHGGPVRLVVPPLYGWKSAKFLNGLEFLPADAPGYWEERGYHNRGDYWKEERYW